MEYAKVKNVFSGQTSLEICLALIIGVLLITGAVSVWNHYSKIKVERMDEYRETRYDALNPKVTSSTTGQQLAYTEPPFDIFSMINSVGSAPVAPGPGPNTTSPCYPAYNLSMNISATLLQEVADSSLDLSNLSAEAMELRGDFSSFLVWIRSVHIVEASHWFTKYDVMCTWFYSDSDDFFENDWDQVSTDFENKVQSIVGSSSYTAVSFGDVGMQTCDPRMSRPCPTVQDMRNTYTNPGLNLEHQTEDISQEIIIKKGLAPLMLKVGEANYNACERSYYGEDTTCDTTCGSDLAQAEISINNSISEVKAGQYTQGWNSWQQAETTLDNYRACFIDCAGEAPWYENACVVSCQSEYDAYVAKDIETQIAFGEGRLGDADILQGETDVLYGTYTTCYNACANP